MKFIKYSTYLNSLVVALQQTSFRFQTFASLCLYVWLGNTLSPEKVYFLNKRNALYIKAEQTRHLFATENDLI